MNFSDRLKQARKKAGITQAQLSERLGITPQSYSQYETGKRNPKPVTIYKIADALKIPANELSDELPPTPKLTIDGKKFRTGAELRKYLKHTGEEEILINIYENFLNEKGQKKLYDYAVDLSNLDKYKRKDTE